MATWRRPNDPTIRVSLDIDAGPLAEYARAASEATGEHVTVTHLVGKAIARAIAGMPGVNGRIVFGTFLPSPTVDVFFLVAVRTDTALGADAWQEAASADLSGVKVIAVDKKTPWEIAAELSSRAHQIRSGDDPAFQRTKSLTQRLPTVMLRPLLGLLTFVAEDIGVGVAPLGIEARPFGTAMVSNVGMLGLGAAFSPQPAISRCIATIIVGEITPKPVVVNGEVVARDMIPLGVSVDHRFLDGYQGGIMAHDLHSYLADPAKYDPLPS